MPRITVTTDAPHNTADVAVVLDERVQSAQLSVGHAAAELVERLGWAIADAERAASAQSAADIRVDRRAPSPRAKRRRVAVIGGGSRRPARA